MRLSNVEAVRRDTGVSGDIGVKGTVESVNVPAGTIAVRLSTGGAGTSLMNVPVIESIEGVRVGSIVALMQFSGDWVCMGVIPSGAKKSIGRVQLDLDFKGPDHNSKPKCQVLGLRFSDLDAPFPEPLGILAIDSGATSDWVHVAATGWRADSTTNYDGPAFLVPLAKPGSFELEIGLDYQPSDVSHKIYIDIGWLTQSNHIGSYVRIRDEDLAASELEGILRTNLGNDTFSDRHTGSALAGTGDRTYKIRALNGTVGWWDDQDNAWHNYTGSWGAFQGYTPAYVFLRAARVNTTISLCYITKFKLTNLI
jgi:hypothetical protein